MLEVEDRKQSFVFVFIKIKKYLVLIYKLVS